MGFFLEGQGEFVGIGVGGELVLFEEQLSFACFWRVFEEGEMVGGEGLDDGVVGEESGDFGNRFL